MNFLHRLPIAMFWLITMFMFAVFTVLAAVIWFPIKLISLGSKAWNIY